MISKNHWRIDVSRHALLAAAKRNITQDTIEATIRSGETRHFGKNGLKFVKRYKDRCVICVGEIKTYDRIKIFTVETSGRYEK